MDKQELISTLQGVLELLQKETVSVDEKQVDDWANDIADGICNTGTDLVSDYELEMSYREVELSDISLDFDHIKRIVKDVINS